jgi:FlaA1/EpsC-like NDP-sugar epimerase
VEKFRRAKAHDLLAGPLAERNGLFVWGAGKTGRRLSKHLIRGGQPPDRFVDVADDKIGKTLRGIQIIGVEDVLSHWAEFERPILLAAVASRGARQLIRQQLSDWGWQEGVEYLCVA